MKKLLIALCMLPGMVLANSGAHLDHAPIDQSDKASLKRGAETFVQYCMGCHAADYMRYNRIGKDLGMTDEEVMALISTRDIKGDHTKSGELMKIAMTTDFAKTAFGTKVPGLTVVSRARGADWLYTYLRTFYVDDKRPTGVNNVAFPDVGMPHVLWEKQGLQKAKFVTETDAGGIEKKVFEGMEQLTPGSLTKPEYDAFVADLVNFMVYMGEPMQSQRKHIGVWVLLFLFGFTVLAYLLKKEYWKDVH